MKTLLWLDDIRDPNSYCGDAMGSWAEAYTPIYKPFKVVWVKSHNEFVDWITTNGLPDAICFDHDLGWESEEVETKTGMDCAKWLVEYCLDNNLKLPLYSIQSANPSGKANIDGLLKNFNKQ